VLINLADDSVGPTASEPIYGGYMGFDWENGQFRLYTKKDIVRKK
jgi:hypothetical protein